MVTTFSPVNTTERAKLDIRPGDTVRVWQKIQEKGKTRLQAFEGLVIARKHGNEPGATFTVRRVSSGVGMERIFPLYSPNVERIEVVRRSKARRAKLYYVREKTAKSIRRKMKSLRDFVPVSFDETAAAQAEEEAQRAAEEATEAEVTEADAAQEAAPTEEAETAPAGQGGEGANEEAAEEAPAEEEKKEEKQ